MRITEIFGPKSASARRVSQGPYGEYLKGIQAQVGDLMWDQITSMSCRQADAVLRRLGVVPWQHSIAQWRYNERIRQTGEASVAWGRERQEG